LDLFESVDHGFSDSTLETFCQILLCVLGDSDQGTRYCGCAGHSLMTDIPYFSAHNGIAHLAHRARSLVHYPKLLADILQLLHHGVFVVHEAAQSGCQVHLGAE
jgi:hypothetical protein